MPKGILMVLALVALCQGNEFAGRSYQSCMNEYMTSIQGMTSLDGICPKLSRLIDCIINGETYANVPALTEDTIHHLETMVDSILAKVNVHCDIDIRSMVRHIAPGMPSSQQACINQYTDSASKLDVAAIGLDKAAMARQFCPIIQTLVTCEMRTLDHKLLGMSLRSIESKINARLHTLSIHCDIDYDQLAEEAMKTKDRSQGGRQPTIADPHTIVHHQSLDGQPLTPETGVSADKAFQHCYYEYSRLVKAISDQDGSVCDHFDRLHDCMQTSGYMMTQQDVDQLNHLLTYLRSKNRLLGDCDQGNVNLAMYKQHGGGGGGRNGVSRVAGPGAMVVFVCLAAWKVLAA